jgi:predicted DNA binding CopG/RHH family protein
MTTDEEVEAFLEQDLSDRDFSQFKPVKFEFQAKALASTCASRSRCSTR